MTIIKKENHRNLNCDMFIIDMVDVNCLVRVVVTVFGKN